MPHRWAPMSRGRSAATLGLALRSAPSTAPALQCARGMEAKRVKFRSSRLAVLFSLVASLVWLASVAGAVAPVLVSSDPAAGESGVNPFLGSFSLRFEQPMRNQGSLAITGPWGAAELLLVGDRTFFHSRSNPGTELPAGATITVTVNPPGSTNPFANLAGEPAATSTFSFTIASGGGSPRVLSSVPSRGAIEVVRRSARSSCSSVSR